MTVRDGQQALDAQQAPRDEAWVARQTVRIEMVQGALPLELAIERYGLDEVIRILTEC